MLPHTRRYKRIVVFSKSLLYFLAIVIGIIFVIFLNYFFKVRNINVNFFDQKAENNDIKSSAELYLRKNGNSILNYILLGDDELTYSLHHDYPIVGKAEISKSIGMDINVTIKKNEEFFYTCMSDDSGFLARCMLGNTDGEYYEEMNAGDMNEASSTKIKIDVVKPVLYDVLKEKQIEEPDSLSGARIFTKEDFTVLREFLNYLSRNGFTIKKIKLDELRDADIYTDSYIIKMSMLKGYVNTVKDFETVSKTGELEKYINGEKEKIEYVDISFKDKVFYKLKTNSDNSTSTIASSTATSTE